MVTKTKRVKTSIGTNKTVKIDREKNAKEINGIITDASQWLRAYYNREYPTARKQQKAIIKRLNKVKI